MLNLSLAARASTAAMLLVVNASSASAQPATRAALDTTIRSVMKKEAIPGAIVGIWQPGVTPYVRAFGVRDVVSRQPMSTNLHMRLGSVTKTFTVTAILQLVDRGKLHLDDPIGKFIKGVPGGNRMTIRQLAQMRSGLYNYGDTVLPIAIKQPARQWKIDELLAVAFAHKRLFAPGTSFDYSNTNTVLLGLVVEKLTGESLGSYFDQYFLRPELAHTVFPSGASIPDPHAHGYT